MSNTRRVTLDLAGAGRYQLGRARERLQAADAVAARLNRMPGEDREAAIENLVSLSGVEVPPRLGRELVLSWDEVREMSRNGIRFGAHTVSHPVLTRVPLETARQEILDSKRRIEEETGQEVTTFAYPNGEPGDYNKDIEEILRGSGFRCAVTSGPAFVSAQTDRYELPRIPASSGFELFQLLMSGLYQDFGRKR